MKPHAIVNAALLLSLSMTAAAAPLAMPYEAAAARAGVAPTQFAILHALLGWKGGSSPTYSFYRAKDEPLLAKTGITVRPLESATERALLEDELTKVRHDRNNGHRNLYNKSTFISPEKMVERHRGLIARYADRVTVGANGAKAPASSADAKLELETLKARGAFFDGAKGEKLPGGGPGSFHSTRDPNTAAPAPTSSAAALKAAVPAPAADAKAGRKPGLFGMLGSLLGGLFRTLGRVGAALFHGALGVGKALLS